MKDEVVRNIIDNDGFVNVASQQAEVFDEERSVLRRVLAVQPVLDVAANVNLVYHLVSVLLKRGCENNDLVVLGHLLNKLHAAWPD